MRILADVFCQPKQNMIFSSLLLSYIKQAFYLFLHQDALFVHIQRAPKPGMSGFDLHLELKTTDLLFGA